MKGANPSASTTDHPITRSPGHPMSSLSVADADVKQDVISGLVEQGYKRHEATAAVHSTFKEGSEFSDAFRDALTMLTKARLNGRRPETPTSAPANTRPLKDARSHDSSSGDSSVESARLHPGGGSTSSPLQSLRPAQRKQHVATKKCACECGEDLPADSPFKYKRGHKPPKAESNENPAPVPRRAQAPENPADTRPVNGSSDHPITAGPQASPVLARLGRSRSPDHPIFSSSPALRQEITIPVSEYELDQIWNGYSIEKKAALIFGRKKDPA